jgi:hypothetical protein
MPNPFSITAATDAIRLDSQGRGTTTFTVSNVSGRARRGRARLIPTDPGQASWLSLDGEAERDFTADGTQQYTVRAAVPPGTPPGRHTFGLDVVSVENPDEEWSQGPKVAFEVPATPPPKKPFPWWILIVVLALLLVGGLVAWLLKRGGAPEAQRAGLLAECRQDADCAEGLACASDAPGQQGRCRGSLGFKPCHANVDCRSGLVCQEQVCRGPLHSSCQKDGDCDLGLTCSNGSCLAKEGSTCKAREDCTTKACNNGTCVSETLLLRCRSTTDCAAGQVCGNSQRCQLVAGQPCSSPVECFRGQCVSGTCRGFIIDPRPGIPRPVVPPHLKSPGGQG